MTTNFGLPLKATVFALTVGLISLVSIPVCGQEVRERQAIAPVDVNQIEASQIEASQIEASQIKVNSVEASSVKVDSAKVGPIKVGGIEITGYPEDWTQHRVFFSDPGSEEEAYRLGRHDEWLRTVNDPRYILRAIKRHVPAQGPAAAAVAEREAAQDKVVAFQKAAAVGKEGSGVPLNPINGGFRPKPIMPRPPTITEEPVNGLKEDWNVPLPTGNGSGSLTSILFGSALTGATVQPNVYPAKYTANADGSPNCPNDYIVYPTGLPGVTDSTVPIVGTVTAPGTPNIIAYNNIDTGLLSGVTSCGTILSGVFSLSVNPNPTVMWAYNTGGAVTGAPILSLDGSQVAYIQQTSSSSKTAQLVLLKWSSPGNTAGVVLTVGGLLQVGATETINGYEYGYGVANIGLLGGLLTSYPVATAPSTVSCGSSGGAYQLAKAGEGTGTAGTPYMCVLTLKGTTPTVTNSNPFPDYLNGAIYVGDDQGNLHKFSGLSVGEPGTLAGEAGSTAAISETTPLNLSSLPLGEPAFDSVSGCIFVGDSAGYLYEVDAGFTGSKCNSGTFKLVAKSVQLANGTTSGILDAPMVDSNSQAVYVSVSASSTAGGLTAGSNAVYEFLPGFAQGASPTSAQAVGTGGSSLEFMDGDFDNTYFSSSNGTGYMYVVGNTHTLGNGSLFQIPINNNSLGTAKNLGSLNTSSGYYAYASPVMEFCNNGGAACAVSGGQTTAGVDIVYFSVYKGFGGILGGLSQALTNTNCSVGSVVLSPGGCIYGVNVSNPAVPTLYADYYTSWVGSATNPCWVTSGFVVDNASTSLLNLNAVGIGSQMYFVGMNGNSDSLPGAYDPCGATKTLGNTIYAQQIGQGNLVL